MSVVQAVFPSGGRVDLLPVQESHYASDTVTVLQHFFCLSWGSPDHRCIICLPVIFFPFFCQ